MWSELGAVLAEDWRRYRRRYLIEAFVVAAVVVGAVWFRRSWRPEGSSDRYVADFRGMMETFCKDESHLMKSRAETCRQWAAWGVDWELPRPDTAGLRICPYPWDTPASRRWSDQADVWDRAAARSARTAERYARW
jgi:hypothetical protein